MVWLPESLSADPRIVWKTPLENDGLAGIAATADFIFVGGRDLEDKQDVFQCLSAEDGSEVWAVRHDAEGHLDYGNSPRATPLVHGDHVFFLGAFGHLRCVLIESGEVVWSRNLYGDFGGELPTWGACASPLIADGKLIVNPGGAKAAIVALEPTTGKVVWETPGRAAGYGSFNVATLGGTLQLVGHDAETLGGWDVKTGRRLWELKPPERGDFNVPTPLPVGDRLFVVTENNGSRLYQFDKQGRIIPQPVALNLDLAPDTSTPVVVGDFVIGCWIKLWGLELQQLQTRANFKSDSFRGHASLIGGPGKVLVIGHDGELHLFSVVDKEITLRSRQKLFTDPVEIYSHPALVGSKLYVRGNNTLQCVELDLNR